MNKIVFAGSAGADRERANKCLEIVVQGDGGVAAIPPYCGGAEGGGLRVYIEQAITPLKVMCVLRGGEAEAIAFAAERAAELFGQGGRSEAVLNALGDLIVSYVNLCSGDGKEYSPVVKLVLADISKNVSNAAYALDDALKKLPLNYDYVRKLFQKETGATPHGYLVAERMRLASNLILSGMSNRYSEYTVSQIAEACGFSEPLYFSRAFKKYYGVAPSEYGKNL